MLKKWHKLMLLKKGFKNKGVIYEGTDGIRNQKFFMLFFCSKGSMLLLSFIHNN